MRNLMDDILSGHVNAASIPIDICQIHRHNLPIRHGLDIRECSFPFMGKTVHLKQGSALRAAKELFFEDEYGAMDVEGKTVLDIGCSDGDTAVYFLLKGARNVIGYDMLPEFARAFYETLRLNGMAGRAGIIVEEAKSLGELVRRHDLKDACLKMDCEGCEYPLLENATDGELHAFNGMIMEYHKEPEPLEERLEKAGFKTRLDEKKPIMHAWREKDA